MPTSRRRASSLAAATAAVALLITGCAGATSGADPQDVHPEGEIVPRQISWLLSRPADGGVITTMEKIADEYAADHPGFSLNLITTPDRPSYIQKYETLAAANKLPELFDTDATPFAQKLASQGRMMDVDALLTDLGVADEYRTAALDYQRFDDGSLRMVPFEFQMEFFWYNSDLLRQAGVDIPATLDDFPAMCEALRAKGITPIALDGQDQWPLERYMAYYPFRMAGPQYLKDLKSGKASFADPAGRKAAEWLSSLGKAGCFQDGFSATGYADAQAQFTSGKAAIYNIGTWELANLATDALDPSVRGAVDYFTLPTIDGAVTDADEYMAPSGIGMAVNSRTYDPLVRDFLAFALQRYPELYAATGALSPTTTATTAIPTDATPLYSRAVAQADGLGSTIAMPWDTQLDPATNTRLQQELTLLVQGDITPDAFIETMDASLTENSDD
ncbi:ABC transporter substrate-binding protein [Clavibacter nebraskensis]|uniref:Extracellular solute-binding protein n=2 Tax=Clavibacter nebraskensis TaxID=31963 RepID=A0A399QEZ0_9MICO|nr:extracellular solute-binding protein [Clavibacter nebraskensis]KXU22015.1 sugar-binding protein [Clavibacter nebraskensis]OAH18727.1 sugar-binding protein [Clavibacter nebraskensis]QGV65695.1 extracellular solute-binding protein [Clavibacter nebraskensis]QGV68491.1 extracellular solute-binding protein [Clavibacter nebraskensis]QGV71282.1 extracellular solute-binding protein [Clavibacter nebraskensis]